MHAASSAVPDGCLPISGLWVRVLHDPPQEERPSVGSTPHGEEPWGSLPLGRGSRATTSAAMRVHKSNAIPVFEMAAESRVAPRDLLDVLLAEGVSWVTAAEAARRLRVPRDRVPDSLERARAACRIMSITKGAWLVVPPEYLAWGAPPPTHFIDAWIGTRAALPLRDPTQRAQVPTAHRLHPEGHAPGDRPTAVASGDPASRCDDASRSSARRAVHSQRWRCWYRRSQTACA